MSAFARPALIFAFFVLFAEGLEKSRRRGRRRAEKLRGGASSAAGGAVQTGGAGASFFQGGGKEKARLLKKAGFLADHQGPPPIRKTAAVLKTGLFYFVQDNAIFILIMFDKHL